ncbi:MAG TPA: Holliday junction resolvase RuvX [Longimicrobiales bacterium]|nr:Holliday junction resolvase RuvX [Longimicrobiales bacterium]
MGRTLAIDFGGRRIGLAISDPTATVAQPLPALVRRRGKRPPVKAILDVMSEYDVECAVVGLPLSLDGDDTEWTAGVREFAARLAERAGIDVFLIDERMTSVAAERTVRSLGLPRAQRERKDRIDTAAAMLILQAFLDRTRGGIEIERAGHGTKGDHAH